MTARLAIGGVLALALAGLIWARDASTPAALMRVVCDATVQDEADTALEEPGQYGRVTVATCYRDTFQGEPIMVLFVD